MAFKLVTGGIFDEAGVTELLHAPGLRGDPLCSGTRNLQDNLSDLRAQARVKSDELIDMDGGRGRSAGGGGGGGGGGWPSSCE